MRTIDANGTTIAFKQTGSGAPVILIHGAEADHSMFDAFGARLARHFMVIAYDQRDSGGTRNPAAPYGLAELADDVAALIAGLGYARAHVFGTSLGGVIAQMLAVRHSDRVGRLVLSSTFRAGTPPLTVNPEVFPKLAALRAGLPGTAGEIAGYFFTADYLAIHPEAARIFSGSSRDAAQKQRRAAILARPIECDLAAIATPTLVLVGAEDRLIPPAHTLALAGEIVDACTATIAGVGHVATLQDPNAVARVVLAFLQDESIGTSTTAATTTTMTGGNDHERPGSADQAVPSR